MEKIKLTKDQMSSLFTYIVILVIGILFCCSMSMGVKGISILIGISMIVTGLMYIINSIISTKNLLNLSGFIGSAIIALGSMFISRKLAELIFDFIPFLLIIFGMCIVIDSFLKKFVRKEGSVSGFIGELLIGAISLALGFCLKFISTFSEYASLILGIILVVYSVVTICEILFRKKGNKCENANKKQSEVIIETPSQTEKQEKVQTKSKEKNNT